MPRPRHPTYKSFVGDAASQKYAWFSCCHTMLLLLKDAHEVGSSNWMTAEEEQLSKDRWKLELEEASKQTCAQVLNSISLQNQKKTDFILLTLMLRLSCIPNLNSFWVSKPLAISGRTWKKRRGEKNAQRAKGLERACFSRLHHQERPTSTKGKLGHPRRQSGDGCREGDSAWQRNRLWPEVLGWAKRLRASHSDNAQSSGSEREL